MTTVLKDLKTTFEESSFFGQIGFEISCCDEDEIELMLPIEEHLFNTNQTVHGGVYATMIDNILCMVVRSSVGRPIVTVHLNINYLAPAKEGYLIARGKILQQGYKTVIGEAEIFNQNNQLLAKGTGTFSVVRSAAY